MNFDTKYNEIGKEYNSTRVADEYLTQKIYEFLQPNSGGINLDIGCGTGNYTIALVEKGLNFVGVEPSIQMLEIAKAKNQTIEWKLGSAEKIPFSDHSFENVIATLTIHHWKNIEKALEETYRVLIPQGKLVIFTSCPTQMENYWLNHYFPKMMRQSILQMPSIEKIKNNLEAEKFEIIKTETYSVDNSLQDFFLYSGKERPEIYLQEKFRKGISSFASLANKEEVEKGLQLLENDLRTKDFQNIKSKFNKNVGDYTFLVAQKLD